MKPLPLPVQVVWLRQINRDKREAEVKRSESRFLETSSEAFLYFYFAFFLFVLCVPKKMA